MAWYTYAYKAAFDPTTQQLAANATGEVFAVGDTQFTNPLPTFDLTGIPVVLTSTDLGFLPEFQVEGHVELLWKSGDYVFHLTTTTPLTGAEGPAVAGAELSGDALTFTLDNGTALPPVTLPTGPGGSDEGVASYVQSEGSATDAALRGRFVSKGELGVNIKDAPFNAVGDGVTDDTAAVQAFFDHLGMNGGRGVAEGTFRLTAEISIDRPEQRFSLFGSGDSTVFKLDVTETAVRPFFLREVKGCLFRDFVVDGGRDTNTLAGHGVSAQNCQGTTFENVTVRNYGGTAILFMMNPNFNGDAFNNHLINCTAEGNGLALNGFMHETSINSSMQNCRVFNLDKAGNPSYALQLKNNTTGCSIIGGFVSGANAGVAFGNTTSEITRNAIVRGVSVVDCNYGLLMGYAEDCDIDMVIDMSNRAGAVQAVRVGAACFRNTVDAAVSNVPATATACYIGHHHNNIRIRTLANNSGKILELNVGAQFNTFSLGKVTGYTPASNPLSLVVDNSGHTSNRILWDENLTELMPLTGNPLLRFPTAASRNNWIQYNTGSNVFAFRVNGADVLTAEATRVSPGVNNAQSLGWASRLWTQLYAATGTINTSDERAKQDWETDLAPELRAWSRVEYGKYRMRDSVADKGDGARWHVGIIAQRVKEAFEAEGLDAFAYGILCHDEWEAQAEEVNEEGEVVTPATEAGDRFGIRYEEALALEAAYLRSRLDALT